MKNTIVRGMVAMLAAMALLSACGGDDDKSADPKDTESTTTTTEATTTTVDPEAEKAAVGGLLTDFFALAGQGKLEEAAALIENGEAALPRLVHCEELVKGVTIEMTSVELTDATNATALFAIMRGDAVLLAESGGGAVKIDGRWLVSENTFLSLYDAAKDSCTGTPPPTG